jgi:disulfide bond formation protein DsbB
MVLSSVFERATTGWRAPALLAGAGVGAIAAALFMQHVVGVQPCILCVYQRWPYVLLAMIGLAVLVFGRHRRLRVGLLALAGLVMVVGCGIAMFHVGVEQHWWSATAGCGVPPPAATVEELRARLLATPTVRCDEVSWSLFGISLAGYNIVLTLLLAGFALVSARRAAVPKPAPKADSAAPKGDSHG